MRNFSSGLMILVAVGILTPSAAQPKSVGSSEAALAKLDLDQKDMVAKADVARLTALAAPRLTINVPTNRVLKCHSHGQAGPTSGQGGAFPPSRNQTLNQVG